MRNLSHEDVDAVPCGIFHHGVAVVAKTFVHGYYIDIRDNICQDVGMGTVKTTVWEYEMVKDAAADKIIVDWPRDKVRVYGCDAVGGELHELKPGDRIPRYVQMEFLVKAEPE